MDDRAAASCLDEGEIALLVSQLLSPHEATFLRAHTKSCGECQRRVLEAENVARSDALVDPVQAGPRLEKPLDPEWPADQTIETPVGLSKGDVLANKYIVEREIGVGGMGQVVYAKNRELDLEVAIKVMHSRVAKDERSVARFRREARAMAKLKSEHVVRIYDLGEDRNGTPFLVMEYLEGESFSAMLADKGPFGVADLLAWGIQVCDALEEAHAKGLVHRDLKPSNLFLAKRAKGAPTVRVLDFGLAKQMVGLEEENLTRVVDIVGTPYYMAPEQINGDGVDPRSDVWAIGASLYRCLTGVHAFPGDNTLDICKGVLHDDPVPLGELRKNLPPELERAVARCLKKVPNERIQSVTELAEMLRSAQNTATKRTMRITKYLEERAAANAQGDAPPVPPSSRAALIQTNSRGFAPQVLASAKPLDRAQSRSSDLLARPWVLLILAALIPMLLSLLLIMIWVLAR